MGTVSCFLLLSAGIIKDSRSRTDCLQSPQYIVDNNNFSITNIYYAGLKLSVTATPLQRLAQLCIRADWAVSQRNRSRAVQHFLKTSFVRTTNDKSLMYNIV